jgi:hypothetical protein
VGGLSLKAKLGRVESMISVELNGSWMAKFPHGANTGIGISRQGRIRWSEDAPSLLDRRRPHRDAWSWKLNPERIYRLSLQPRPLMALYSSSKLRHPP